MCHLSLRFLLLFYSLLFSLTNFFGTGMADNAFSTLDDLDSLASHETATTVRLVDQYIQKEQSRLDRLRKVSKQFEMMIDQRQSGQFADTPASLSNPVNAYLFIKHLLYDWWTIRYLLQQSSSAGEVLVANITENRAQNSVNYPDEADLEAAAQGLLRLQRIYELNTTDLANAIVDGIRVGDEGLAAKDCYLIGIAAHKQEGYAFLSLEWMEEGLRRNPCHNVEAMILEHLANEAHCHGKANQQLLTQRLAQLGRKESARIIGNNFTCEQRSGQTQQQDDQEAEEEKLAAQNDDGHDHRMERAKFERLCRGQSQLQLPPDASKLLCYLKMDKPFLRLAPLNVEILHQQPLLAIFRGVLSDTEIAEVKQLARPRLSRAPLQHSTKASGAKNHKNHQNPCTHWRTTQLDEEQHPVAARIHRRIQDMTNLKLGEKKMHVANYGIGDHFTPHFDFIHDYGNGTTTKPSSNHHGRGDRVATVLFYLSRPTRGGQTVFTELGIAVTPSPHDALFWYNLKLNGEGDVRTKHASCPVLNGLKWVVNKLIYARDQDCHARPCPLQPDAAEEYFVGDEPSS